MNAETKGVAPAPPRPERCCTATRIERGVLFFMFIVLVVRGLLMGNIKELMFLGRATAVSRKAGFRPLFRAPTAQPQHGSKHKGSVLHTKGKGRGAATQHPVAPLHNTSASMSTAPPSRAEEIRRIEKQMWKGLNPFRKPPVEKARAAAQRSGGEEDGGWMGKTHSRKLTPQEAAASWDIMKKLKTISKETPLLLNKAQFQSPEEPEVLRNHIEYTENNTLMTFSFPRGLSKLVPDVDAVWQFETCAIVGNSGVILLRDSGEEIDRHNAVFRINMAPIRGFATWVGQKTTFNIVNAHNVREMLLGPEKDHYIAAAGHPEHIVSFEAASDEIRHHLLLPLLKRVDTALLLNPVLVNKFHATWLQLRYLLEQESLRSFNRKPMSGFFTVMFALQVCSHINLYGFDAYQGKRRSYRYHYFDNINGFTEVHSFDLAFEIFKIMSQQGMLAIQV